MPSRLCPNCDRWISEAAPLCERCGQQVRPRRPWHREPLDCARSPAEVLADFFSSRASRGVLVGARTAENVVLTAFEYARRDPGTFTPEEREKLRRWGSELLEEEALRHSVPPGGAGERRERGARELAGMLVDSLRRYPPVPGPRPLDPEERLRRERVRRAALALLEELAPGRGVPHTPYGEALRRVHGLLRQVGVCMHCERTGDGCRCGCAEVGFDPDGGDEEEWMAEWEWDDDWSGELAGEPLPPPSPVLAESRPLPRRRRALSPAAEEAYGWRASFRGRPADADLLADPARRAAVQARALHLMSAVSGVEFGAEEYDFEGVVVRTILWVQREPVCLVCGEVRGECACPFSRL